MVWTGSALPAVVFGRDFGAIAWLFPLLALRGGIASINSVIGPLFWAIGEPWKDRRAQLWRALALYGLGIPLAIRYGAAGFAAAATVAITLTFGISLRYALDRLAVPRVEILRAFGAGLPAAMALLALLLVADLALAPEALWRAVLGIVLGGAAVGYGGLRSGLLRRAAA